MKAARGLVFAFGAAVVVSLAGDLPVAHADKGGNGHGNGHGNPGNINSMVPNIGNSGPGNGRGLGHVNLPSAVLQNPAIANLPGSAAINAARPSAANQPLVAVPASLNSATIGRSLPGNGHHGGVGHGRDFKGKDFDARDLKGKDFDVKDTRDWRGNEGKGRAVKNEKDDAPATTRVSNRTADGDKSKEREAAQNEVTRSESAAATSEPEAVRLARLPSCS